MIEKFERVKEIGVYSRFEDNIWTVDLGEMGSLSYLIIVLNICHVWQMFSPNMLGLNLWRIKKLKQFFAVSLEWQMNLNAKPNKLWVDQGKEFYNNSIQKG